MTLRSCAQIAEMSWITDSPISWEQLVLFGPAGLDAYARLRFIPDPARPGQAEADAEVPDGHPSDWEQARQALAILERFTTTPDELFVCVWEGCGTPLPPAIFRGRLVGVPDRQYVMAQGTASDLDAWESLFQDGGPVPAFVWPADHAWCFASDVDPHWAGIGGSGPAVEALVNSPLDVVEARPADKQPCYY